MARTKMVPKKKRRNVKISGRNGCRVYKSRDLRYNKLRIHLPDKTEKLNRNELTKA